MPLITNPAVKARKSPSQCQKPRGWLGKLVLWSMNRRHAGVTGWGLRQVSIGEHDMILDVGCGGGRTVATLAAGAAGRIVHGIDYSMESVNAARRTNSPFNQRGPVSIPQASVAGLPFADNTFDLVTAVETHFWWQDLAAGMQEVFRVLKPGGRMLIVAEFYNGGKWSKYADRLKRMTTMAILDVEQHRAMFSVAGFTDVRVVEEPKKGWISVVGSKR